MYKRPLPTMVLACVLAGFLQAAEPAEEADQPLSVLQYLGDRATRMADQLPQPPDDAADWVQWREATLADLASLLNLPERQPMKAVQLDLKQQDDLVIEQVGYLWADGAYVSGNVIRTAEAARGRKPALVVPPGWLGHYTWICYKPFVFQMARQGYVVLFIDDPHIGKRSAPNAGLYAVAGAAGTPVMGIQVFDTLRGLDYLLTRADVDPGRIGVVGLCQGAEQAWLAGALEWQFKFVVPICGTTTYESWARMPTADGVALSDPSPYIAGILGVTDWDRIGACVAPRPVFIASNSGDNWWPVDGYNRVVETMTEAYALHDSADRFRQVRDLRSHDMTAYLDDVSQWINAQVESLPSSDAAPLPCGEADEPDFKMLRHFQRQIAANAESFSAAAGTSADWDAYRESLVDWLRAACRIDSLRPGADQVLDVAETGELVTETLALGLDGDFRLPAVLVRPSASDQQNVAAIILSHDSSQCMADSEIAEAAAQLASAGYWVLVPEHASLNAASRQPAESRGLVSLYGVGDTVGMPPLALRVADNLAAVRYLASRPEVDILRIVAAGRGVGAIDACLATLLDDRIAGATAVDVTTLRDWAEKVAPEAGAFAQVMPYLPGLALQADLDHCLAAVAPQPLVLARLMDGWSESGYLQVEATARQVFSLYDCDETLLALGAKAMTEEQERNVSPAVEPQLLAAARALMPAPPVPGVVGTKVGLKSRATCDSAVGIVWVVNQLAGYAPTFADGYRLETWSFFNDNGAAQRDRVITPVILKREGDLYRITGVGTTRVNSGQGLQTFAFEVTEGTDEVAADCYFGWHTGDPMGATNAGVAEFDNDHRNRMTILTLDGQLSGQRIAADNVYREQSSYPRAYSVQAVATQK